MNNAPKKESVLKQISREYKNSVEWEKIEYDGEVKVYVKGAEFPLKCAPSPECVWSLNIVKKTIVEFIHILFTVQGIPSIIAFLVLPKRKFITKLLDSFNKIGQGALNPYLNYAFFNQNIDIHLTACARGVGKISELFFINYGINQTTAHRTAELLAHFIEYDGSYRFRLLDIMAIANYDTLITHPRKEVQRIIRIASSREREISAYMKPKWKMMERVAWILVVPSIKKAFIKAIEQAKLNLFNIDDSDFYWMSMREEYNYFGRTNEERMQTLKDMGYKIPTLTPVYRYEWMKPKE